jgi:hypothetical protein
MQSRKCLQINFAGVMFEVTKLKSKTGRAFSCISLFQRNSTSTYSHNKTIVNFCVIGFSTSYFYQWLSASLPKAKDAFDTTFGAKNSKRFPHIAL